MNASSLAPVTVENWTLWNDGSADWMRIVEIGERAEMAQPLNIRQVAVKLIADGAADVIGDGAAEILRLVEVERRKAKSQAKSTIHAPRESQRQPEDARGGRAVFLAKKVTVPITLGGFKEVVDLYANAEAAVLLAMRLRTPRAVAMQCEVVHVFVAVVKGRIGSVPAGYVPAAEVEAANRRSARLEADLDAERAAHRALLASSSSTIGTEEQREILKAIAEVARVRFDGGLSPSVRSASRSIRNRTIDRRWNGPVSTIPRSGDVAALIKRDLARELAAARRDVRARMRAEAQRLAAVHNQKRSAKRTSPRRPHPAQQELFGVH